MVDRGLLAQLTALLGVIMIGLVLSGACAVVAGTAAAGLPGREQRRVILAGSGLALLERIALAPIATKLPRVTGLPPAGGPAPAKSLASAVA